MLFNDFLIIENKYKIPFAYNSDLEKNNKVVIHLLPANTDLGLANFYNIPKNTNYAFVIPQLPGNTSDEYKPKKFYKFYLRIINEFIKQLTSKYPNIKKILISGESWGANLAILMAKYYQYNVICWNAALSIVNTTKFDKNNVAKNIKKENVVKLFFKHALTFLFNINLYCCPNSLEILTDNERFKNLINLLRQRKKSFSSVRINIATWMSMHPAYKYLIKHFKKNMNSNIIYIQTQNDIYFHKNFKKIAKAKKYQNDTNKIIIQDKGMHLLGIDANGNDKIIWDNINLLINK